MLIKSDKKMQKKKLLEDVSFVNNCALESSRLF